MNTKKWRNILGGEREREGDDENRKIEITEKEREKERERERERDRDGEGGYSEGGTEDKMEEHIRGDGRTIIEITK